MNKKKFFEWIQNICILDFTDKTFDKKLFIDAKSLSLNGLYEAQLNKYDIILNHLNLTSNDKILEVGCGWGSLALQAVKRFNCCWYGLTISEAQLNYAKQNVLKEKLEDKIKFKFLDYRYHLILKEFLRIFLLSKNY